MINLTPLAPKLNGKSVAIFGLARSGMAAAQACKAAQIPVAVWDDDAQRRASASKEGYVLYDVTQNDLSAFALLVLSPGVPLTHPAPHPVVKQAQKYGVEIVSDIEILGRVAQGNRIIGITGTNGKSTTTALIAHILNQAGVQAIACGNIGDAVLGITLPPTHTTIVIELSSFQIDLCPSFRPEISVLLNITPDHIDRHGTLENYASIKARVLEGYGVGIVGVDDDYTKNIFEKTKDKARKIIPFSTQQNLNAGLYIDEDCLYDQGANILNLNTLPTLKGLHNWQNVMAAYLVCRTVGVHQNKIIQGLLTYPGLPHRQYLVRTINNVFYINDSKATNADATEKALKTFKNIYWIVGGKPKAGGLNGLEVWLPYVRKAYVIGEAADDFSNWLTQHRCPHVISGVLEAAVAQAHADAQADENAGVVLLSPACASYDQFQSYEHRGDVFVNEVMAL